ncbi:MAG: hypothetical protein NE334_19570 [Lentisphaeraceae bacterium]|nr:hypothetical protein [Lentisphaeraceae bacterium]
MKLSISIIAFALVTGSLQGNENDKRVRKSPSQSVSSKKVKISELPKMVQEIIKLDCSGKIKAINKVKNEKHIFYTVTTLCKRNGQVNHVFDNRGNKIQ